MEMNRCSLRHTCPRKMDKLRKLGAMLLAWRDAWWQQWGVPQLFWPLFFPLPSTSRTNQSTRLTASLLSRILPRSLSRSMHWIWPFTTSAVCSQVVYPIFLAHKLDEKCWRARLESRHEGSLKRRQLIITCINMKQPEDLSVSHFHLCELNSRHPSIDHPHLL